MCGWACVDVLTCRCGGVRRQMTVRKKKKLTQQVVSVNTWVSMWMCWRAGADDSKKKERETEKRKEKKTY